MVGWQEVRGSHNCDATTLHCPNTAASVSIEEQEYNSGPTQDEILLGW